MHVTSLQRLSLVWLCHLPGWIKGENTLETTDNMVGQSVMSCQLGYYKNDYNLIGVTQNNLTLWTRAKETLTHQSMYNGNISWMETDLIKNYELRIKNDRLIKGLILIK